VSQSASIQIGEVNGYSWIRICGKGDVFLAPSLKKLTDKLLKNSSSPKLVVDMEDCSGMDSTFMGTLASLAIRFKGLANACFQLCGVTKSNQDSLEELGLDSLIDINPKDADWSGKCDEIRSDLSPWSAEKKPPVDRGLVLETHKALGSISEKNMLEFSPVIQTLEEKL